VSARAGSEGKLFGSITSSDIVTAIEAQTSVQIDRRKLVLAEPIKSLGTHVVPVKLHADVEFPVTIDVVAE
jgi:large subunit ribosomal protein L9